MGKKLVKKAKKEEGGISEIKAALKKHDEMLIAQEVRFGELKKLLDFLSKEIKRYEGMMAGVGELDTLVRTIEEVKAKARIIEEHRGFVEEVAKKIGDIYIELEKRFKTLKLNEEEVYRIERTVDGFKRTIDEIAERIKETPSLADFKRHVIEVKSEVARELNSLRLNIERMRRLADEDKTNGIRDDIAALQSQINKEIANMNIKIIELEKPTKAETPEELKLLREIQSLISKIESSKGREEASELYKRAYERYELLRGKSSIDLSLIFKRLNEIYTSLQAK